MLVFVVVNKFGSQNVESEPLVRKVKMTLLLLALILGSIPVFWNLDSYIRVHRDVPSWKECFSCHVAVENKRAYDFFVATAIVFAVLGFYHVTTMPLDEKVAWLKDNTSELLAVLAYIAGLGNYMVRRFIARNGIRVESSTKSEYVWDAFTVGKGNCKTNGQVNALWYSNFVLMIILVSFLLVKLFQN